MYGYADRSSYVCINSDNDKHALRTDQATKDLPATSTADGNKLDLLVHDGCIFPAMKLLYLLRKQIRQKTSVLSKLPALLELKRNSTEEEIIYYEQPMQLQSSKQLSLRPCRQATSTSSRLQQNIQDSPLQLNLSDQFTITTGKGVGIVYIDRNTEEVVFRLNKSDRSERLAAKGVRGQSKELDESDDLLPSDLWHQLLSRLPSDAVNTFDDMMNEIHGKLDSNGSEICMFLPHGWVWAASTGSR